MGQALVAAVITTAHHCLKPFTGRRVLVSPHRAQRPRAGLREAPLLNGAVVLRHGLACPQFAGSALAKRQRNRVYFGGCVVDNDFAAVGRPWDVVGSADLLDRAELACGCSRVTCHSPPHGHSLAELGWAGLGWAGLAAA